MNFLRRFHETTLAFTRGLLATNEALSIKVTALFNFLKCSPYCVFANIEMFRIFLTHKLIKIDEQQRCRSGNECKIFHPDVLFQNINYN